MSPSSYVRVCVCVCVRVCISLHEMCIRQLFRTPNKSQKRAWSAHSDMMKNYKMGENGATAAAAAVQCVAVSSYITNNK